MLNQIKALLVTLLLFGGVIWFALGKPSFGLPDMPQLFNKEEKTAAKTTKRRSTKSNTSTSKYNKGQVIDNYKGVNVFFNGSVTSVSGRNTTKDGYNLGLKYQCVELAKRFYYEAYNHKMPDSYGHAKDFFSNALPDGGYNKARNMTQFRNGGLTPPRVDDLGVIGASQYNQYGHLFIITKVTSTEVSFIQQNPGHGNPSRGIYRLLNQNGRYTIDCDGLLGWLRI